MSNFNKLTLVVLTFERPKYLIRLLEYYINIDLNVIILDGSKFSNTHLVEGYLNNKITYYHEPIGYLDRIKLAVKLVKTDYITMACDDEFYSINGLTKILSKLENDKSLVACKGMTLGFSYHNNNVVWTLEYPKHLNYSRLESNPIERVNKHISKYPHNLYYSVVRQEIWKKSFLPYMAEELSINAQGEIIFEISTSYFGKHCVLPILHHFRSFETSSIISNDISLQSSKFEFFELWLKNPINDVAEIFLENISLIAPQQNKKSFKKALKISFNSYSKFFLQNQNKTIMLLKRFVPKYIRTNLKLYLRNKTGKNLKSICTILIEKNISFKLEELKYLEAKIKSFFSLRG